MYDHKYYLATALLIVLIPGFSTFGQQASDASSTKPQGALVSQRKLGVSPEEEAVRTTYEKLVAYCRGGALNEARRQPNRSDNADMRFAFKGFRSGPIQEITGLPYSDLVTQPSGEIVHVSSGTLRENDGEPQAIYTARWDNGQYASIFDPHWTIRDVMQFEPAKYYDVGKYSTYEVTVSFRGKSRTYRALVLYHDLFHPEDSGRLEFWDSIVGMGGTLSGVWEEKALPYKPAPEVAPSPDFEQAKALQLQSGTKSKASTSSLRDNRVRIPNYAGHDSMWDFEYASLRLPANLSRLSFRDRDPMLDQSQMFSPALFEAASGFRATSSLRSLTWEDESNTSTSSAYSTMTTEGTTGSRLWFEQDFKDHASGSHLGTAEFSAQCLGLTNNQQRCEASVSNIAAYESGTLTTFFEQHAGKSDGKPKVIPVPEGQILLAGQRLVLASDIARRVVANSASA